MIPGSVNPVKNKKLNVPKNKIPLIIGMAGLT